MRRQRRHVRVRPRLDEAGAVGRERPVPRRADVLRPVDPRRGEPERLRERARSPPRADPATPRASRPRPSPAAPRSPGSGRRLSSTRTTRRGSSQLPPVLRDRDELVHAVHLHRAVADERDHERAPGTRTSRRSRRAPPAPSSRGSRRATPIIPCRILTSRAYQFADEPESPRGSQRSGSRGDSSQNTRCGFIGLGGVHRARLEHLPPLAHFLLDLLPPAAVRLALAAAAAAPAASPRESPTRFTSIG